MKVYICQCNLRWCDREGNRAHIEELLSHAGESGRAQGTAVPKVPKSAKKAPVSKLAMPKVPKSAKKAPVSKLAMPKSAKKAPVSKLAMPKSYKKAPGSKLGG